jgi:hypothetical protein
VFNRESYQSTTEYVTIFSTKEKADKYVAKHKKDYSKLQELYYEEKTVL